MGVGLAAVVMTGGAKNPVCRAVVFWEAVGVCSYLLIGFWFDKKDDTYGWYADCGKKAFIVNRIGDFGMLVAMFMIWSTLGSLVFGEVGALAHNLAPATATIITRDDIERYGFRTVADVLNFAVPGYTAATDRTWDFAGGRGLSFFEDFNTRILVMLDGHPMNEPWNNFSGIGHCDTCPSGWVFPSPRLGVRAQIQLLKSYAIAGPDYSRPLVDRRLRGPAGCCEVWGDLTTVWATDPTYGPKVMLIYSDIVAHALARRGAGQGFDDPVPIPALPDE